MIDDRLHKMALWSIEAGARREGVPMAVVETLRRGNLVELRMPMPCGRELGISYMQKAAL